ncbi:MAG: helix-turn-helix transcriptional regulator [Clostridia bacterium]|nr:helix-turn-helix transcriptional regulator [Clostridia bacterium]
MNAHYDCPCLEKCPLNRAMDIIGGKWKIQILCSIDKESPIRYNQLRRKLDGVSNTVLAKALKELERDGLIERKEYSEVPIRVEYSITNKSASLMPILEDLSKWGEYI